MNITDKTPCLKLFEIYYQSYFYVSSLVHQENYEYFWQNKTYCKISSAYNCYIIAYLTRLSNIENASDSSFGFPNISLFKVTTVSAPIMREDFVCIKVKNK